MRKPLTIHLSERDRDTIARLLREAVIEARQAGDRRERDRLAGLALTFELAEFGDPEGPDPRAWLTCIPSTPSKEA